MAKLRESPHSIFNMRKENRYTDLPCEREQPAPKARVIVTREVTVQLGNGPCILAASPLDITLRSLDRAHHTLSEINPNALDCLKLLLTLRAKFHRRQKRRWIWPIFATSELIRFYRTPSRWCFPVHGAQVFCNHCSNKPSFYFSLQAFNFWTICQQPCSLAAFSKSIYALSMPLLEPRVRA